MKGIILSGGSATRLRPVTQVTSKQLLPIYNKPMIYYPLETLISGGIRDILIIIAPDNAGDYLRLLGSGRQFGCKFAYEIQDKPEGLAQALIIGENFIKDDKVALILGDNIFEDNFSEDIRSFKSGARVFAKEVPDPERFGVVAFDKNNKATSIEEKPQQPKSNFAVTGLYIYDNTCIDKAKSIKPSARGELEITDVNRLYLEEGSLDVRFVNGAWLDAGTFESWFQANAYMRELELRRKQEGGVS